MLKSDTTARQMAFDFNSPTREDELGFELRIKRSGKRRTIEIIVRENGVDLMMPNYVSEAEGLAFVRSKQDWIVRTLVKQRQLQQELVEKQYVDNETFHFLGNPYPLRIYISKNPGAQLVNGYLYVGIRERHRNQKPDAVKKQLWTWYQQQALRILTEKTMAQAATIGRKCEAVTLRRTKTKWGHCTSEGVIQYNWQIISSPEAVVDYLVAHEVSHLVHQNHGKRFWRHVEKLCPDYLEHEKWLKHHGHKINL